MDSRLGTARSLMQRHFGHAEFRGVQAEAVSAALAGRDVLVLMPTGGGKSLCYQVPALVLGGLTLVVSPLISLMEDQVAHLARAGVPAAALHGGVDAAEVEQRLESACAGRLRLLYLAPERLETARLRSALARMRVSLLVVDEAHCVVEWGEAFRPAYLRLGRTRQRLGCPAMALTATATLEARRQIVDQLRLQRPRVLVGGFDRPNLWWGATRVRSRAERDHRLIARLRAEREREGVSLVYAATRREADLLADYVNRAGLGAAAYHAGIGAGERATLQARFMAGRLPVMVATSAFGMGVDKRDVRLVVHAQPPGSLEAYYQEAGRAGRDGMPADCLLLCYPGDVRVQRFLLAQAYPDERIVRAVHAVLAATSPGTRRGEGGLAVLDATELSRLQPGIGGVAVVESAVRVLERDGALRRELGGPAAGRIRLLARSLDSARRDSEAGGHAGDRALLEILGRTYREPELLAGVAPPWPVLARALGGTVRAREALERLGMQGILEWWLPSRQRLRLAPARPGRPDVDWTALAAARRRARRRLDSVVAYIRRRGCRRARLLRHFGEAPPRRCTRCDRCLARSAPFPQAPSEP